MNKVDLDRFRGAFIGVTIGDALGVPHELRGGIPLTSYEGIIKYETTVTNRFGGSKTIPLGQYSDDTEMMLTMFRSILQNGGYNPSRVLYDYMIWASSKPFGMGKNTRELLAFKSKPNLDKWLEQYRTRYKEKFGVYPDLTEPGMTNIINYIGVSNGNVTQSNGSLMRCLPLAIFNDYAPMIIDIGLTNPSKINLFAEYILLDIVRLNLQGFSKEAVDSMITNRYDTMKDIPEVVTCMEYYIKAKYKINIYHDMKKKGWVLHAFYFAIRAYFTFESYQEAIDWIIVQAGDTDTNGSIGSMLMGSYIGFNRMMTEPKTNYNYNVLISTPKRPNYDLSNWLPLTEIFVNDQYNYKLI